MEENTKHRLTELLDESVVISGMIQEIIMKAKLFKDKIQQDTDEETLDYISGSIEKYQGEINTYRSRLDEVNKEIYQINGSP